jgi:hypothetical protein
MMDQNTVDTETERLTREFRRVLRTETTNDQLFELLASLSALEANRYFDVIIGHVRAELIYRLHQQDNLPPL